MARRKPYGPEDLVLVWCVESVWGPGAVHAAKVDVSTGERVTLCDRSASGYWTASETDVEFERTGDLDLPRFPARPTEVIRPSCHWCLIRWIRLLERAGVDVPALRRSDVEVQFQRRAEGE